MDLEQEIRIYERYSQALRQIDDALERISAGRFAGHIDNTNVCKLLSTVTQAGMKWRLSTGSRIFPKPLAGM